MKPIRSLLIANRGEIAIRIARAAAELGIRTVAVFSSDDASSLHVRKADEARPLEGFGAAAYLDIEQIVAAARETGCDAVHPGYGFLSENAAFARRCAEAGIAFAGPLPEALELFGDKVQARALAAKCGVPLLPGTAGPTNLREAQQFMASLGPGAAVMVKAVAGGGGRGMRAVEDAAELEAAFARCQSEARAAFGIGDVYLEELIRTARHIEVQVVGDGRRVVHLWERECSVQRRHQKLVEIAPSVGLPERLRQRILEAALTMAEAARYQSLGTFEFLVDAAALEGDGRFFFIEANPRLQVEHTVTEEVTGIDLVQTQLRIAGGASLASLGLTQSDVPAPRGFAIQLRINMETMDASGGAMPSGGVLAAFDVPSGPGVRVDTFGYTGYATSPSFDSLLAKLIVHSASPHFEDAVNRAYRALCEFRIEGVDTNIPFLQALLRHPGFAGGDVHTRFVEAEIESLLAAGEGHRQLFFASAGHGAAGAAAGAKEVLSGPPGTVPVLSPMQGVVVAVEVAEGDLLRPGQQVAVVEAMKMEHIVRCETGGIVRKILAQQGDQLMLGRPLLFVEPREVEGDASEESAEVDLDAIRPDLAEMLERHRINYDEARPEAVARRRKTNQRTARENIEDLCDPGSFVEYGALALAAQRRRRTPEELLKLSPADGLVGGIGTVNASLVGAERARCMVMSYDYTVLAGTQGTMNHKKMDRLFELAEEWRLPVAIFTEGGGGRPGDTDKLGVTGLDTPTFKQFARLNGIAPLVGINSGRCFAGNAALLGCCDVIVATENSTIGMGGPAMIEGGGLGVFAPEEVGPVSVQVPNGVVDVLVEDEAAAVATAKRYLGYFQGPVAEWEAEDQRLLRRAIPENRLRVYDVRTVIATLADKGSVLELRPRFGIGILTALVRIEGKPFGLIANNPNHLGGAIDADAADKAARFIQLCGNFDLPIVSLCDTPGFMVGPDAEKTALVRHVCRMFVAGANASVPFFTVVLRKGYGLGAQAMAAGSFRAPFFTISWPTGEFGGMGLEGAVRLAYRKELAAIEDPQERQAEYQAMVAKMYEMGKATSVASYLEIDAVIDPVETRRWILRGLNSVPPAAAHGERKRRFVDTW